MLTASAAACRLHFRGSVTGAAAFTLVCALAALFAGVLSRRVAGAPGSREYRWFTVVVLASAAYALLDLPTMLPASRQLVFSVGGLEVVAVGLFLWGWLRFSQEFVAVTPGRLERVASAALLAALPVFAVPGVLFSGEVVDRPYPPLGVVYRLALTTPIGDAVFVALLAAGAAVLVRFVRAWGHGLRHAGLLAVAYAVMLAFALADALSIALVLPWPLLLDAGFVAPVIAAAWVNACRLVESTRALEALRVELAARVELRTRALASALESLHAAEELAALGRFAGGVAHEVNNPAAAVTAALRFLAESPEARLGPDEAEALADARSAMRQITGLVRELLDAAMVAVARPGIALADVPSAIARVVAAQPEPVRAGLAIHTAAADARVRLRPDVLELVVDTLLRNALDATPAGAADPIVIRAERGGGRVRVTVADPGAGMSAEVLRRVFDPFFTTKPRGRGRGLGLAVARGLVQAGGGKLTLESLPGHGTRAILELPEARDPDAGDRVTRVGQPLAPPRNSEGVPWVGARR